MPSTAIGPVAAQGQEPLLSPADMWRLLRRSWPLIVTMVLASAAVGVGLYWWQLRTNPRYQAEGLVVVRPQFRVDPRTQMAQSVGEDVFDLRVELRTQTQMLLQSSLWADVLEKNPRVRESKWFKSFEDEVQGKVANNQDATASPAVLAKEDLTNNFRVSPVTDTKLLRVTMDTKDPVDGQTIIQAIVGEHITNQQKATSDRANADLARAREWKFRYERDWQSAKDALNAAAAKLSGGEGAVGGRFGAREMEMSHLMSEHVRLKIQLGDAQAQLDAIEQSLAKGEDSPQVEALVRNDQSVARLQYEVETRDADYERNKDTMGNVKALKELESSRDRAREKLANIEGRLRATYRDQLLSQQRGIVQGLKSRDEALIADLDRLRAELGQVSSDVAEYYSRKDEADSYKVLAREMEERVQALSAATRDQRVGVTWNSMPTIPETRSSPRLAVYLPAALAIGLALSLGIAFLREVLDTTVRSPRDIARVGPINVLGMIADESDDPQLAGVPLHAVIGQAPHSVMAEQIRQVRTRLQHAASLDTTRTIVVTSPGPGDGKSMVACNLAAGLALNGRRILLVDANFRRPELHKLFGVSNELGFANVLDSVSNLESAVQKTSTPNLELLTTGPKAANPTELLESQLFSDFIDRALEEYDHVIFDAGPLLVVSEAVALAPRVDGVITVVRARVNSRGMLSRVRDTLKQIKAEHLGVVLNGVQTWGGGYYGRTIKTYYAYQNAD
ncbi:MAG: polysaccharide biosynthesis tyrosine autokinase [Burkholderiales bacterium]|nr:polysaccharide biosynthesis tyrosine autokinase [Phycisphaerae bacterium]